MSALISLETIEREIDELESRETTYKVCERLCWLYTVRDHLLPTRTDDSTQFMSGSDFLKACSGVSYTKLMRILDEHMSALSVVQPREYESVMDKVRSLR